MTMASCPNINCTYLDQFNKYTQALDLNQYEIPYLNLYPDFPQPPLIVADADIAGLGVTTVYPARLYFYPS